MAQHFLKSAKLRDFTLFDVSNLSEDECFFLFSKFRWKSELQQICPHCGVIDAHYFRQQRKQWRCKHCDGYFSVTTRTPFEDHKLPFKKMLLGIMMFIHEANGISLHKLARVMDIQIKTAQSFVGRLRESIFFNQPTEQMSGTIQMDGGYFGGRPRHGRVRKKNDVKAITAYVDGKLSGDQSRQKPRSKNATANWVRRKKRRVVMVLREIYPEKGLGAKRTIVAISKSENEVHAMKLATTYVAQGAKFMTDENAAYNQLSKHFEHETVQHAIEFSTLDGVNDNQAESFFSRLRRYVLGVGHRIEPKYLADIAVEMAWREDVRRKTEREKLDALLSAVFARGLSRWWRGYWQGYSRDGELCMY